MGCGLASGSVLTQTLLCVCLLCRRYAEPLLDILVAGGVLAPGGGKVEGTSVSPASVFSCEPMVEAVRGHLLVRPL